MPSYRGISRGLCTATGIFGAGLGNASLLVRFKPPPGAEPLLRERLLQEVLAELPSMPGLGSAYLFEGAATPVMTKKQSIRGADATFDWAVLVIGYSQGALAELAQQTLGSQRLAQWGATGVLNAVYRLDYSFSVQGVV